MKNPGPTPLCRALAALVLTCCLAERAVPAQQPTKPARKGSFLAFYTFTLEGRAFDFTKINQTRRIVVYLFEPDVRATAAAARAVQRLHEERHRHNIEVLGVLIAPAYWAATFPGQRYTEDQMKAVARHYMRRTKTSFPCAVDATGALSALYSRATGNPGPGRRSALFTFALRAQRSAGVFFVHKARRSAEPANYVYRAALKQFGIEPAADVEPLAGDRPKAPDVKLIDTAGKTHRLADYRGRLVVLVFFLRKCPKCKAELAFLQGMLEAHGRAARRAAPWLEVLAVCTDASGAALKSFVAERGYTFPVAGDPDWAIRGAFRFRGEAPDTFVIAPDGTVRYRHRSYTPGLGPILEMEIRTLLGLKTRPKLGPAQYTGRRSCRVCHAKEHTDWTLTRHACAWETLVRVGRQADPECVRCHVVGFGHKDGFVSDEKTPHLADVQCESCHGGNGCSAFTGRPAAPVTAAACRPCHDAKHSPRFHFPTAHRRTLHNRAAELAELSRAQREAQLKKLCSGAGRQLFDPDTPYIGSAACGKCHPTAYKALGTARHTTAARLLTEPAADHWRVPRHKRGVVGIAKAECLRCHVTGFGRPGGFPPAAPAEPLEHPMAGVGCEACHGPGKAHAEDPKKPRAIARLGGTCSECSILPICRQCHDDRNSPRFDYRAALEGARHPVGKAVAP